MKWHAFALLFLFLLCISKILGALESESRTILCANLSAFQDLWKDNAYGKDPNRTEKAAWIVQEKLGRYEFVRWRASDERSRELWHGELPANVIAQVHTHPQNSDEKPSTVDRMLAARIRLVIYVISSNGIWSADPAGEVARVANWDWHKKLSAECR